MKSIDLSLYLVTEQELFDLSDEVFFYRILEAIDGGVTTVQLRDKTSSPLRIYSQAKKLLSLLKPRGIPLIINDFPLIALEVGAQGVHVGQGDLKVSEARKILGKDAVVGLSLDASKSLDPRDYEHCTYVAASPVFMTTTKTNLDPMWTRDKILELRRSCNLPIVAIGGIQEHNVGELAALGIDGVAVVSAIMNAECPSTAAKNLKTHFLRARSEYEKYTQTRP